jgi:tetratricopeptide (TPR) repeat protein
MGVSAAQLGDWRKALEHQHAALALSDPDEHPRARAEIYQRIGDAHAALNEPREAETAYLAALQILERDNVAATDSSALWRQLAELAKQQSHWQDATVYYARARAALPAETSAETAIELAIQQGDAALRIPDRDMTQTCYDEAFEWAQTHIDRAQLGVVYERLGTLAQSRREWDEALAQLQEAIEIQRELKQPLGEARILNDIARLKLEMQNASEADLFAQAALSIAQAFGSASETSRSLYVRALAALETQEFDLGERFLSQAIATDPNNVPAQLQLGNTLLAMGRAKEAGLQAEAGLGQSAEWELGARTQLTIVALNSDDTRAFRQHLKHTRARLSADAEQRRVSNDFIRSVELIVEALEGNAENALGELDRMRSAPALPTTLDAAQFARTGLLALSKSPRRFKGKPALVTYFALPKMRSRKNARRRSSSDGVETDEQSGSAETE